MNGVDVDKGGAEKMRYCTNHRQLYLNNTGSIFVPYFQKYREYKFVFFITPWALPSSIDSTLKIPSRHSLKRIKILRTIMCLV